MPTLTFTAYQLIICTLGKIRTSIKGFGDPYATIAPQTYFGGSGGIRTPNAVRPQIYSLLSNRCSTLPKLVIMLFCERMKLVSFLIIITQGVTHPSVTLLFLSPDVATTTRGTITLFAGYLGFEPRTTRLTVESSTAELIPNLFLVDSKDSNLVLVLYSFNQTYPGPADPNIFILRFFYYALVFSRIFSCSFEHLDE